MASRSVRVVILCEDTLQEVFITTYLRERGLNLRQARIIKAPSGKGAGEQFVREWYVREVREFRRRATYQENLALAVMIDADTQLVSERLQQFDTMLDRDDLERRRMDERIAIFVPKRHIETWIRFAAGEAVDEATNYHEFQPKAGECKPHVRRLANVICQSELANDAPPSLRAACDEIRRVL